MKLAPANPSCLTFHLRSLQDLEASLRLVNVPVAATVFSRWVESEPPRFHLVVLGEIVLGIPDSGQNFRKDIMSGYAVRTKPQAPRSLRRWLSSSFVAGLGWGAQEVTDCDPPTQNDARRARAP